jgi:hypothetical protein
MSDNSYDLVAGNPVENSYLSMGVDVASTTASFSTRMNEINASDYHTWLSRGGAEIYVDSPPGVYYKSPKKSGIIKKQPYYVKRLKYSDQIKALETKLNKLIDEFIEKYHIEPNTALLKENGYEMYVNPKLKLRIVNYEYDECFVCLI